MSDNKIKKIFGKIKETLKDTPEKRKKQLELLRMQRKVLEEKRLIELEKAKIRKLQPKQSFGTEFGFGSLAMQTFPKKKKHKKYYDDDFFFNDNII